MCYPDVQSVVRGGGGVKLSAVAVTNHTRVADLRIEVRTHLVMVGPNGAGKSALLRCLDMVLGASTAQLYNQLTAADFRDATQSLVVEVTLEGFTADDRALFADEITVDPSTNRETLTIRLEATVDTEENLSVRRTAPGARNGRSLSRKQLAGLGWNMIEATGRARDLRADHNKAIDSIIESVDLGAEQADFERLVKALHDKLDTSAAMGAVREKVADQLSLASPDPIAKDDLRFVPASLTTDDVLGDVRLLVTQGGSVRSLAEHSDGTRALYAMALYDLVSASSSIVAIDEPEIHLHPASQRSLARILQAGGNQKIIATQSSDIVGAFDPECVVTVKRGGVVVQPAVGFLSADQRMMMRWWVRDRLEPLTATRIIAVEGTADRIIVQRAAEVTRRVLDRLGVSVLESGGAGDMGPIHTMFGPTGFQIPLSVLIDADAEQATATKLGIQVADLTAHSVWVSRPDLEGEYVAALGAAAVWTAIQTSGLFAPNELGNCAATGPAGTRTDDDVAAFCRRGSNYKVRAAIAVAGALTEPTARKITSIESLLFDATGV